MKRAKLWALGAWLLAAPAMAITVEQPLKIPQQEATAQAVFHALKCVVCEGQPLSESDAELAMDMRRAVREMVAEGKSEQHIIAFFVKRYGDAILLKPPAAGDTLPLWLLPMLFLIIGGAIALRAMKKREGE
jgi:cytochrome c-type biogenesis protein CcmH